jgi:broad specificity phosphatase PhoE
MNVSKYIKYKKKYLDLKTQMGGNNGSNAIVCNYLNIDKFGILLISFDYGMIYDVTNDISYIIYGKTENDYNLYSIMDNKIYILRLETVQSNPVIRQKWFIVEKNMLIDNLYQELYCQNTSCKKIVIFIRHGSTIANNTNIWSSTDTPLDDYIDPETKEPNPLKNGILQSKNLGLKLLEFNNFLKLNDSIEYLLPYKNGIDVAIISPLIRTFQTAVNSLEIVNRNNGNSIPIIPIKGTFLCTEQTNSISDTGKPYEENINKELFNKTEYDNWYNILWKDFEPKKDKLLMDYRCQLFEKYLKSRKEKVILVYSHRSFISQYFKTIVNIPHSNKFYHVNPSKTPNWGDKTDKDLMVLENTGIVMILHD